MQNGTLSVTASGNAITATLSPLVPGNPILVDFFDRAGAYHTVSITGPISTTIAAGVTGGLPSLLPCRGWWHLVDGPTPQLGFACYTGPSRILRPRDGGIINAAAPANNPFAVYTPTAVANASARIIASSTWETGLAVAGQWTAPTNTDLWQPGMPLPLDIIDGVQDTTPVSQFTINGNANQWYDTNISLSLQPKSAANAISVEWAGNGLTSAAGHQITVGAFRNGAIHVGLLGIAYSGSGQILVPVCGGAWLDFPASSAPVSYVMKLMGDGGGNFAFSYGANVSGANGQPAMQLAEVMT